MSQFLMYVFAPVRGYSICIDYSVLFVRNVYNNISLVRGASLRVRCIALRVGCIALRVRCIALRMGCIALRVRCIALRVRWMSCIHPYFETQLDLAGVHIFYDLLQWTLTDFFTGVS